MESQIHPVIDNGSGFMKVGFSGESTPRYIYPTIVGKTKVEGVYVGNEKKESIIGDEANQKFGILDIVYPIQEGLVTNWNDMEKIWHHTFYSILKIAPEEYNIFLSESPFNPRENREKTAEMMFDLFNVSSMFLLSQSVLSLYAVGKSTGIAIDVGEGSTNIAPVYEGFLCNETVTHNPIAGKAIHDTLIKLLEQNGQKLDSKMQKEFMKKAKEEHCYITSDFQSEENNFTNLTRYQLPDNKEVSLGREKYQAPEVLFNPKAYGYNCLPLQDQFLLSFQKIDYDIRNDMLSNIICNGGTTLMKGFKQRTDKEIRGLTKDLNCKVKVHCYPEAQFAAWIGGSILSSMDHFSNLWISKKEYKEQGSSIIHKKCF